MPELSTVYAALHRIMAPYAAKLDTKRDDGAELYIDTRHIQKNNRPLFFGAVRMQKSYVGYHLMPVYVNPMLLAQVSPALLARMQGKSCFNFRTIDRALLKELAALTKEGYESYVKQGFCPERN